jgi:hypothetical protein
MTPDPSVARFSITLERETHQLTAVSIRNSAAFVDQTSLHTSCLADTDVYPVVLSEMKGEEKEV